MAEDTPPMDKRARKMSKTQERRRLHDLCRHGKLKQVKELLRSDSRATQMLNEKAGMFGYTPLHEATCKRCDDVLEQLLLYGGDPNAVSNGYYTPLHMAASNGHVKSVRLLLKYNANIKKKNEFGKTPFQIAELNRRPETARVLKSAEVKLAAAEDYIHIGRLIQDLQCGKDVEKDCFDEALKIAVRKDHQRAAGYLILQGAKNIEQCLADALQKAAISQTATLLLSCHAAEIGDREMLKNLFLNDEDLLHGQNPAHLTNQPVINRPYFPREWGYVMTFEQLFSLRSVVNDIDMSFPVSIAVNKKKYDAAKVLLFNKYCDRARKTVDWHGLALPVVLDTWIMEIRNFEKLIISFNDIIVFPRPICSMKNLLRLDVSHNHISSIPYELLELPLLRNLNLSHNRITNLPDTDDWTKSLKILNISANSLKALPETIASSSIKDLNVARNELNNVQLCICNLTSLTSLDISSNKFITVLPPELGRLNKLDTLEINNMDQINDPPEALRHPTTSLIRHLRARLRGSEPYFTMKLMLVGFANRGKTTLLHRLNNDVRFNRDESTKGVVIQDVIIRKGFFAGSEQYTFRCWDFAGQEEYYATHQCFLSRRSLYLIVWRLTDGKEGIEGLRPWLDNLVARVPGSTAIFVGTHLDKVTTDRSQQDVAKEANLLINQLVASESRYRENICIPEDGIVLVSSNSQCRDCQPTIERLRQRIFAAAEAMTNDGGVKIMGESIPSSYLALARLLKTTLAGMQEGQMPILSRQEFEQLALRNVSKNSKEVLDEEDLTIATKFLHDIGVILHYDDPNQSLRDLYFISPSWLCRLMAQIVTVKESHNFFEKGILHVSKIPLILGRGNKEFPPEFYAQYLRLLYRFQIACRIDHERILVPSMLTNTVPSGAMCNNSRILLRRIHSFTCIPNGFWSRFIGRMLLYMKDMLHAPVKSMPVDDTVRNEKLRQTTQMMQDSMASLMRDASLSETESDPCSPTPSSSDSPVGRSYRELTPRNDSPVSLNDNNNVIKVNGVLVSMPYQESERSDGGSDVGENGIRDWSPYDGGHFPSDSGSATPLSTGDWTKLAISETDTVGSSPKRNLFPSESTANSVGADADTKPEGGPSNGDTSMRKEDPDNDSPVSMSSDIDHDVSGVDSCDEVEAATIVDSEQSTDPDVTRSGVHIPERLHENIRKQRSSSSAAPLRTGKKKENAYVSYDDFYFESVDVAELLRTGVLQCWQTGLMFDHPKLYFCVRKVASSITGRESLETCVSRSSLGSQVLTFVVDHIRTLVREWYPGLSGNDGQTPYVVQFVPCPVCCEFGVHPVHHFDIRDCLKEAHKQDFICCPNSHSPRVVDLRVICPDLMFQDLPPELQLDVDDLSYEAHPDHLLGAGAFGMAYRGLCGDESVAIKEYKVQGDDSDWVSSLDVFYDVRQEVVILSKLKRHPFIIDFLGVCMRPTLCAVMQLADQGSLKNAIHTKQVYIERAVVYKMARQVIDALKFIHFNNMIHRDLKSENILLFSTDLTADVNVKITDFGTANFINSTGLQQCIGTPGYHAPEMLEYSKTDEYTVKVDVYSYGILLSELITKRRPFYNAESVTDIDSLVKDGKRPTFGDCAQSLYGFVTLTELMKIAWESDSRKRPTSKEVYAQTMSPLFLLLFGKVTLLQEQSPRQLCSMPYLNEVWIMCDSPSGSSVAVVDMRTAVIKEILKPNTGKHLMVYFNLALMEKLDNDHVVVVLRGSEDLVLVYSAERKKQLACFPFTESHILAVTVTDEHLFLGLHNGWFLIASKRDFIKGKLKVLSSHEISSHRPVLAVSTFKSRLFVANSKYVYTCKADFSTVKSDSLSLSCVRAEGDIPVSCIMISPCYNFLYTSSLSGSSVSKWRMVDDMTPVDQLDCATPIKRLHPEADAMDLRVSCFVPVHDTVWVGTGSGHLIVFCVPTAGNASVLAMLHPYRLEVRSMALHYGNSREGHLGCLESVPVIITTGKALNETGMSTGAGCLITLNGAIPQDESLRKTSTARSASTDTDPGSNGGNVKVVLMWHALPSAGLKALLGQ